MTRRIIMSIISKQCNNEGGGERYKRVVTKCYVSRTRPLVYVPLFGVPKSNKKIRNVIQKESVMMDNMIARYGFHMKKNSVSQTL